MSFLKRLLGVVKKPQVDEKIRTAVLAFLNAQTWDDGHQVVKAHREELLSEAADQVFQELLVQHRDNPKATQVLEKRRDFLARCRREGIEAAFAWFSMESLPDDLQALLNELQNPPNRTTCPAGSRFTWRPWPLWLESPGRRCGPTCKNP